MTELSVADNLPSTLAKRRSVHDRCAAYYWRKGPAASCILYVDLHALATPEVAVAHDEVYFAKCVECGPPYSVSIHGGPIPTQYDPEVSAALRRAKRSIGTMIIREENGEAVRTAYPEQRETPSFMPDMRPGQYFYWLENTGLEYTPAPERMRLSRVLSAWANYYGRTTGRKYSVRLERYIDGESDAFKIRSIA